MLERLDGGNWEEVGEFVSADRIGPQGVGGSKRQACHSPSGNSDMINLFKLGTSQSLTNSVVGLKVVFVKMTSTLMNMERFFIHLCFAKRAARFPDPAT